MTDRPQVDNRSDNFAFNRNREIMAIRDVIAAPHTTVGKIALLSYPEQMQKYPPVWAPINALISLSEIAVVSKQRKLDLFFNVYAQRASVYAFSSIVNLAARESNSPGGRIISPEYGDYLKVMMSDLDTLDKQIRDRGVRPNLVDSVAGIFTEVANDYLPGLNLNLDLNPLKKLGSDHVTDLTMLNLGQDYNRIVKPFLDLKPK